MKTYPITRQDERMQAALAGARSDAERAALLAHATTPGDCDAEYCPWAGFKDSMCIRSQTHHKNCRCPDCFECEDFGD